MKRAAYFLCAPAVCLALFWRVLFTWFRNDDFGFLTLPQVAQNLGLAHALFYPAGQGTIRVLSDRLYFLAPAWLFGVWAAPFRVIGLLTWFATLMLAAMTGARMAGSKDAPLRSAGLAAALLWTTSHVMVMPLTWAAIYEVILCSFLMVAALYSRMRWLDTGRGLWRAAEWTSYLLAFGAQESAIMYPAVALLYNCCAEKRWPSWRKDRDVFAMLVPAAMFASLHLMLPRLSNTDTYKVAVDARLPATMWTYIRLALGPETLHERWAIAPALGLFLLWRLWRRDWLALFCVGWFALFLAPVAPLPNHISIYYLATPLAGLAWLGGWALVSAWRSNWLLRGVAIVVVTLHLAASVPEIRKGTEYYQARTARMRVLFRGVESVVARYPGTSVILQGVDNDLFQTGIQDNALALAGAAHAYLVPGTEAAVIAREDLGGIAPFRISTEECLRLIEEGKARVLDASGATLFDATREFEPIARAEFLAAHRDLVDAGQALYASRLGPTWLPLDNGFRWMPKTATVQLAGPASAGERLFVTGYGAADALAKGPVTLRFRTDGQELGAAVVQHANEMFRFDFALPEKLIGRYAMEVSIEASRTFLPPGDRREHGMVFGTFRVGR